MSLFKRFILYLFFLFLGIPVSSQIALIGDNAPHPNILDGDFNAVWTYWRAAAQSPHWTTKIIKGKDPMGVTYGTLFCMNEEGIAESKVLNTNPDYQQPVAGDVWNWSFGADLEYISDGTLSLSLVFGENERILAERVKLKGSDKIVEHFNGTYTITEEDAKAGMPFVRATFYSGNEIKVFLHYVNISVVAPEKAGPELSAEVAEEGIQLQWSDDKANPNTRFGIYRMFDGRKGYTKLGETKVKSFVDETQINGREYTYVVTRINEIESAGSNKVILSKVDAVAPSPPTRLETEVFEAEVKISWTKSTDKDVESYSVYRGTPDGMNFQQLANNITGSSYMDFTPSKDIENSYVVFAHDFSGNRSIASDPGKARVKAVFGTSFSDLILPMPIHENLSSEVWGAEGVIPRDPDNGIEHPDWSYWGGRPVEDKDGKYHMCVTRWPANATKGHWEWPHSTVAYVVADKPAGPYKVERDLAYDFYDGLGHNPDIILLNDGTYMLYSLIGWEATLFTSETMRGPWKRLGTMTVNTEGADEEPERFYRFYRNLSGVHLADGRFLFVTKAGAMIMSEGKDPLGPYSVLSSPLQHNSIIPEKYRNSNYEDPVIWKDEVQFHMMINAFLDYRAIYLRSSDGIHWKFNPGTAYTPNNTFYEDGTQTRWYKLERPHVLTDEYGRATHLSLAAIDVPKRDDLAQDKHSSKNIIIPLTVHKRIIMLNKEKVTASTKSIKIQILSEAGFNPQKDIDVESLRFGASEEVDFGRGCKAIKTKKTGKDLIIEFDGTDNGITDKNFACKLLGRTNDGELIIGFSRLGAEFPNLP
ncbi:hypothetical protein ACFLTA_00395 [Bacteroidota bacterium]